MKYGVFYYLNENNKLVPIIEGDRKCNNEIELSNFHNRVNDCETFINIIRSKINSGLEFCNGFNFDNILEYCKEGRIYFV